VRPDGQGGYTAEIQRWLCGYSQNTQRSHPAGAPLRSYVTSTTGRSDHQTEACLSCAGQLRELTVHQGLAKASTVVNEGFFFSSVMSASGET
jgi:hypothetical protein